MVSFFKLNASKSRPKLRFPFMVAAILQQIDYKHFIWFDLVHFCAFLKVSYGLFLNRYEDSFLNFFLIDVV